MGSGAQFEFLTACPLVFHTQHHCEHSQLATDSYESLTQDFARGDPAYHNGCADHVSGALLAFGAAGHDHHPIHQSWQRRPDICTGQRY